MLLDTNIVSYIYKGDSRAAAYQRHLLGHQWFVSFMTLAEIYRWPFAQNWAEPRRLALEQFVHSRFVVLPFNQGLARTWADLGGADRPHDEGAAHVPRRFLDRRHRPPSPTAAGHAQRPAFPGRARSHRHHGTLSHAGPSFPPAPAPPALLARHLSQRTSQALSEAVASLLRGLIRERKVERDGDHRIRRP